MLPSNLSFEVVREYVIIGVFGSPLPWALGIPRILFSYLTSKLVLGKTDFRIVKVILHCKYYKALQNYGMTKIEASEAHQLSPAVSVIISCKRMARALPATTFKGAREYLVLYSRKSTRIKIEQASRFNPNWSTGTLGFE